ncbi:MAG: Fic family protein [Bacteroidetes bacterium]|nr:Fic family protein [Bacteroidota bacterium]MBS1541347.1 Fic family protein [Bacteroidota bacterium]
MSENIYKINPDRSMPWNDLPDLPIAEEIYRHVEIYEALSAAKESLGRLYGRSIAIPNQGLLINTISLQEAKESSAIENIFTTDDELYKAFSENLSEQINSPAKEVLRYREALWSGHEYLRKQQFDQNYFISIYRIVNESNDGIRPAFVPTYIKQSGSGPNAGKPAYVPPRGDGIVEKKLQNLLDFVNDDEQYNTDPLLKMAISHFQFEAIHPFRDGNGRTGRIFNIHLLVKKGLLDYPILYLSRYINQEKENYYRGLSGVSQRGDWQFWLLFMLKAVEVTAHITFHKITDIINLKDSILHEIEKEKKLKRPEQLIQTIFTQPFTKVAHLTENGFYSENTARNYLNRLAEMKILEKRTVRGYHYYLNLELYRILQG